MSESASPAFAPWGMLFELEDVEDPPPEEVEVCAGWLLDVVEEPELEEFEPQAATPRATRTSRAAARRRGDLVIVAFIFAPVFWSGKPLTQTKTPTAPRLFPHASAFFTGKKS